MGLAALKFGTCTSVCAEAGQKASVSQACGAWQVALFQCGTDPYHRGGRPGCQGHALVLHRHLISSAVILSAVGQ